MKTILIFLVVGLLSALADKGTEPKDHPAMFKITTKRDNDTVEGRADKKKTAFIVKSPFGISQAVIERTDEKWPESVVLRLHLKGLESFKALNGKVMLDAAVSSQGDNKVRTWKDSKEDSPLDAKSPYWMEIRMVGSDTKPAKTIPLKDGYFEMALPKAFFEENPKAITLKWIDFYRN